MFHIRLNDPPTEMTMNEISIHNLSKADKYLNLKFMIASSIGWLKANPDLNIRNLEEKFREKNFNTHIIMAHDSIVFSCKPKDKALNELLSYWTTYNDNFNALPPSRMINEDILNESLNNDEESNIALNKKILEFIPLKPREVIERYREDILRAYDVEPTYEIASMTQDGRPIYVMTVNGKAASPFGITNSLDGDIELVKFNFIQLNSNST